MLETSRDPGIDELPLAPKEQSEAKPCMPQTHFRAPVYIAWEVTHLCNAECIHCYSRSGPHARESDELDTREALELIDELADAGLLVLAFSGGEPLLRKDIFQLIEHASRRGLLVNVGTNGAAVDARKAKRLKELNVRSVTVSLDGVSAAVHDEIRRCPGLFDRALRAIRTLVAHDLRVVISFTPMKHNYSYGREVVELACKLGAAGVNMSEYVPAGRGTTDLALNPNTLRGVVEEWIEMRRTYADRIEIIWHDCRVALLVPEEERDRYSGCGAAKLTARITTNGTLTPCVFLSNPAGSLRDTSFREIWDKSPLLQAIRARDIVSGNCLSCQYKSVCGGCRAAAMSCHGDPLAGDPSCWVVPDTAVV